MRISTDGHIWFEKEKIKISCINEGFPKFAKDILNKIIDSKDGKEVRYRAITTEAIGLAEAKFGHVYSHNPEGYIIHIAEEAVTIYADTDRAKIFAAYSIWGHYDNGIHKGIIYNYPTCEHRSARVYLPPKEEMTYFKQFIDMLVYLGYNTLVLEVAGCMEYKRHPEINEYWLRYSQEMAEFNGKTYCNQISKRVRNSIHTYNAGGGIYSQEELKELVAYCKERCVEIIPEIPSLTHSEYILGAYPELAECDDEYLPDICCPQKEKLNELVFDLYDEAIEVFEPKTLHIGHDEWWVMCECPNCKGKDPARLFADHINQCSEYLQSKGIDAIFWGDKLEIQHEKSGEPQSAAYKKIYSIDKGRRITLFGKECIVYDKIWYNAPENIEEMGGIPHEILEVKGFPELLDSRVKVMDWTWATNSDGGSAALKAGLWTIYGNMEAGCLMNWKERVEAGIKGISVSCWTPTTEIHLQKYPTLFHLGYGALMLWSREFDENRYVENAFRTLHDMYRFRNADILAKPHIEIIHASKVALEGRNEKMRVACPYIEEKDIKLGDYHIYYEDGTEEYVPILSNSNIGLAAARMERWENDRFYCWDYDRQFTEPATVCDYMLIDGSLWYKIVLPAKGKVVNVELLPLPDHEDNILLKEIKCIS